MDPEDVVMLVVPGNLRVLLGLAQGDYIQRSRHTRRCRHCCWMVREQEKKKVGEYRTQ